ncbi:MAG TPA: ketopantoate reductase family protein [Vicinamibacterales bacterium]|nr:ketopantoate reductase family protein [Vicinamibacterales bacterium]
MTDLKILVLGAGGVGGYFGGRLAQAGADVTFLVRPARRSQIVRDGLRVTSPLGDFTIAAQTVVAGELGAHYDLVLLTCKAYDLDSAMEAIAPAMEGACTVLPLLNGLSHLERLDARFGKSNVLGGTCGIDVMLMPDGVIRHSGSLQRITFGERNRQPSARTLALADALARTRLEWEHADDVLLRMWEKLMMLSVLAATTCLFRGNVQEIMSAPGGRQAAERALAANVEILTREGYPPTAAALKIAGERLTDPKGQWSASMMRDMEGGRPVEADHVIGFMLDKARRHGVDDLILSLAYTHLKTYERRRADGRLG